MTLGSSGEVIDCEEGTENRAKNSAKNGRKRVENGEAAEAVEAENRWKIRGKRKWSGSDW
jgi:hypothetical protein